MKAKRRILLAGVCAALGLLVLGVALAASAGGFLTVDGVPIVVRSVDCKHGQFAGPGMTVDAQSPFGWPGSIHIVQSVDGHVIRIPPPPLYSIGWDVFRGETWTDHGSVTYWHGFLSATLTDDHHLVGFLFCPDAPST